MIKKTLPNLLFAIIAVLSSQKSKNIKLNLILIALGFALNPTTINAGTGHFVGGMVVGHLLAGKKSGTSLRTIVQQANKDEFATNIESIQNQIPELNPDSYMGDKKAEFHFETKTIKKYQYYFQNMGYRVSIKNRETLVFDLSEIKKTSDEKWARIWASEKEERIQREMEVDRRSRLTWLELKNEEIREIDRTGLIRQLLLACLGLGFFGILTSKSGVFK